MASSPEKHTVSIYFANAALARLDDAARGRALAAAKIPAQALAAPNARVSAPSFSALWLAVARELDDEFFGLDRRAMKVGSFALLCQAVLACENIDKALKQMLRGFAVFLDDIQGELHLEEGEAVVRIDNRIQPVASRRFADEAFLIMLHGLMCWMAGRRIRLNDVHFAFSKPPHSREYTLMYSQHVTFDAPHTAIRFDARALALPVAQNAASLKQFLRTAPQSVFLKYRNDDSWTARLRRRMRGLVGDGPWPVFEELAAELEIRPTTLRRRLEAEGTSYQGIKDQLRGDLALDLLCHSSLSVDEVGMELGFHDASAFHRAFKRWTGLQPGEYRRRERHGTVPQGQA